MIRRLFLAALWLTAPGAAWAQTPLPLTEAIARARAANPDAGVAGSVEQQAEARLRQARAGHLPAIALTESWQRGNQPVFVFGSLLAQRQFTAANFAIEALNRPAAVDNLRLGITVDQAVFDPAVRAGVAIASVGRDLAVATRAVVAQDLALAVTRAYGDVLAAEAARRASDSAIEAAEADRALAYDRRDTGRATDADALRVDVFLARARERRIRHEADLTVARARLNDVMGESLDAVFVLEATPPPEALVPASLEVLEAAAVADRPEVRVAALQTTLAAAQVTAARAAFLPTVAAQGTWEANGAGWGTRATSWMAGAVARVQLFRGFGDQARVAEARALTRQRSIEREAAERAARLDVRIAAARLEAARAAEAVTRAVVVQARESHRIVRDRYEQGLEGIAALLDAADAVQQAEARHAAAQVEITVAAATLSRAVGTP